MAAPEHRHADAIFPPTDAMIAVGLGELFSYAPDHDDPAEAVRRIYTVMFEEGRKTA